MRELSMQELEWVAGGQSPNTRGNPRREGSFPSSGGLRLSYTMAYPAAGVILTLAGVSGVGVGVAAFGVLTASALAGARYAAEHFR
jgi:hypothetical protein